MDSGQSLEVSLKALLQREDSALLCPQLEYYHVYQFPSSSLSPPALPDPCHLHPSFTPQPHGSSPAVSWSTEHGANLYKTQLYWFQGDCLVGFPTGTSTWVPRDRRLSTWVGRKTRALLPEAGGGLGAGLLLRGEGLELLPLPTAPCRPPALEETFPPVEPGGFSRGSLVHPAWGKHP